MPTDTEVFRAAAGYVTERDIWTTMLIDFMDAKLKDDSDYQVLRRLITTLHLDSARAVVDPQMIFRIIEFNRKAAPSDADNA